jgi:hypothetical protein
MLLRGGLPLPDKERSGETDSPLNPRMRDLDLLTGAVGAPAMRWPLS